MTRRDLYAAGLQELEGMPDARIDARILLEEICGVTMQDLLMDGDTDVDDEQAARYLDCLHRRREREPLAMILGHWSFMGLDFKVTPDTLIPEQDTECLVEIALEECKRLAAQKSNWPEGDRLRILDLCTGTGCILISTLMLAENKTFQGVGTDISDAALAVARENGARYQLLDRTTWLQGDLFHALESLTQIDRRFDLVLTNPPYIPDSVIQTLEPEVRDGEPYLALSGGRDGLDFYRIISREIRTYLATGGSIVVETGFDEAPIVKGLFREQGYDNIQIYNDLGGQERGIVVRT